MLDLHLFVKNVPISILTQLPPLLNMRYDLFAYIPCDEFDAASVKLVCREYWICIIRIFLNWFYESFNLNDNTCKTLFLYMYINNY